MRTWIGGTLAALGALAWAWTMTMLEPATWRAYEAQQAAVRDGTIAVAVDVEYMDQMVLMAKDLRWAALCYSGVAAALAPLMFSRRPR
ncbi:hypothetical protein [Allorhizocola rhizosphaerae]|uniref:hypothetical protein n=1 Tax=Allorhizocola rhizosphaerae TaxID=1872709 RepID=UPI000E3C8027|nr:hypothetical protein [Allorhizocola rhizosphaerae]